MNQKSKRFSQIDLPYIEDTKSKLEKIDLIRNTTNATIIQSDLLRKTNKKLKTLIQPKSVYPIKKQRILQPLRRQHNSIPIDKFVLNKTLQFHSTLSNHHIPQILNSPTNDEHSTFFMSTINPSVELEQIPFKNKIHYEEDSQISECPYRTTRSITPSSSTSKTSHDEPSDTLIIGKLYILNEIYPSIEHENMNKTPLAFLGSEKILRTRIDWNKFQYPLSSHRIEIIIDLIISRPSFIREIPKVTQFNLYRPLIKTVSGQNKAGTHRCDRKHINHKFTIQDLASIHQREFYIINYNVTREQRFINLYENLFQIYHYQTKSKHPINVLRVTSDVTPNNPETHHTKTRLILNHTFAPITPIKGSTHKLIVQYRNSMSTQQPSVTSSPIV